MITLDANYILRFLLKDNEGMFYLAKDTITNNNCNITTEVLAEVVYVLLKVYKVNKKEIQQLLKKFISFDNILILEKDTIIKALVMFYQQNLDFIDSILCVKSDNFTIKTFDKKLNSCIESRKK